ncbi:MAG: hypothetical protein Kow0042_12350 [Calditrichia bacterium]
MFTLKIFQIKEYQVSIFYFDSFASSVVFFLKCLLGKRGQLKKCGVEMRRIYLVLLLLLSVGIVDSPAQEISEIQPEVIRDPATAGYTLIPPKFEFGINRQQLYPTSIVGPDTSNLGLVIDLQDTSLFGTLYSGVFYFEYKTSDYLYPYYREAAKLERGKGTIPIRRFIRQNSRTNVNDWSDEGVVAYRLNLWKQDNSGVYPLGFYDSNVRFKLVEGVFEKRLTLTEGPIVHVVTSDHPEWLIISFETDIPSRGWIEIPGLGNFFSSAEKIRHEIRVSGLQPASEYRYRVWAAAGSDTLRSPYFSFRAAPPKGELPVVFAYAGDGRAGLGGGEREYLGVNQYTLRQIGAAAYRQGARFLLFNGDMVSGYTNSLEDFVLQFKAFKQSLFGFLVGRPIYCSVGNHEALLHTFENPQGQRVAMDRWPYDRFSNEAILAQEFVHPENAPGAYPGAPTYSENVYAFTYGAVRVIVFNNNYWWTSHRQIPEFGGSPEGYILPNQMEWIRDQVRAADEDPRVKYILLMGHEPVFPNGGHVKDAMWHYGNNTVRAYMADAGGNLRPFPQGIIEVRNEFWRIVSSSPKTVAVLGSDEHAYHRTVITDKTPVGVFPRDDLNKNSILDEGQFSPDEQFRYPTWFIVSGGAGAPYYVQEKVPWSDWVKFYSSHYNFLIFRAYADRVKLEVYTLTGQLLDAVDDLLEIKSQ